MSGANKKDWSGVISVLRWVASIVIHIGVWVLGLLCAKHIPNADLWLWIVTGAVAALVAGNLILYGVYHRKLNKLKVAEGTAIVDQRRERIRGNLQAERRRLYTACAVTVIYTVLLAILSLAMAFFAGVKGEIGGFFSLISLYLIYGFVSRLLVYREKPDFSRALPREEYPQLYALAEEAAEELDDRRRIRILAYHSAGPAECNASVTVQGNDITLLLSVTLLCTMSRDELKQVLLHELAHLEDSQLQKERGYYRLVQFLAGYDEGALAAWTSMALRFPLAYLIYEGQFYIQFSSIYKEQDADALAASAGSRVSQASALAKLAAFELYSFETEPYSNNYMTEQVPQHFVTDKIRRFHRALIARGDFWKELMEKELPSRSASHPTFRQRWEALGCCEYDLTPAETESDFAKECWKAAEQEDRDLAAAQEQYQEGYDKFCRQPMERRRAYETSDKTLAPEELRPVIEDYFYLGMPEKAEAVCDQILADHDSPFSTAFASFWKGKLLLYRYDEGGIAYLYQAMEANTNYIEEGLNVIGHFCCMMGLQAQLDEYRTRAPELMQKVQDRSGGEISGKADLSEEKLPQEWICQIVDHAANAAGGALSHVYLVHEQLDPNIGRSAFILRFKEKADPEQVDGTYGKVFALLDDWPSGWDFSLYIFEPGMEKVLNKIPNSCVYTAEK